MDKPEQRFTVDTRVKLREGVDPSLYDGFSRVGNEGWIRKRKLDRYGYPQVLIEWDKDHWAYNGQEDGWTWEGQFEAVKEQEMGDQTPEQQDVEDKVREVTEQFVNALFATLQQPAVQPAAVSKEPDDEELDQWDAQLVEASVVVSDSPAYLIVALERVETEGAPSIIVPRVFHAAREPEQALIIQSQLAHVVASLQDATISRILERKGSED